MRSSIDRRHAAPAAGRALLSFILGLAVALSSIDDAGLRSAHAEAPSPEARANAFVDEWVADQTRGDFDAYAAKYADDFVGVRRSGKRRVELDRATWMKERRAMIAKKATVSVHHVIARQAPLSSLTPLLGTGPSAAPGAHLDAERVIVVELQQEWESAAYKDRGTKRLILVEEGPTLKVWREEMLASEVLRNSSAGCPPPDRTTGGRGSEDEPAVETRVLQVSSRGACLDVTLVEESASNGEFERREWSARARLYRGGAQVAKATATGPSFSQIERFEIAGTAVRLETRTTSPACSSDNDTSTTVIEHVFSIGPRDLAHKERQLSEAYLWCPPHPEGLSNCEYGCAMARYDALKDQCSTLARCQRARDRYDAKHPACSSACTE